MWERYDINISQVAKMALVAYNADGSIRWWNVCCIIDMTVFMIVQYSIVIYCALVMYQKMEEKLQLVSASLRELHRQFFKTLIMQILSPTICLFAPVVFIIYLPIFNLEVSIPTGMFLCAFTLYPALDALIIMYIVKDYRKSAKKILKIIMDSLYKKFDLQPTRVEQTRTSSMPPSNLQNHL